MLTVDINAQAPLPATLTENQLVNWARHALLDNEREANCELAIAVVDEASIRALNKNFRSIDKPTNVLAFAGICATPGGNQHLGDIVICAPVIEREALAQHKPLNAHWAHMMIHGMLHLQGYDHISQTEAEAMEALEVELLAKIDFPNPYEQSPLG